MKKIVIIILQNTEKIKRKTKSNISSPYKLSQYHEPEIVNSGQLVLLRRYIRPQSTNYLVCVSCPAQLRIKKLDILIFGAENKNEVV